MHIETRGGGLFRGLLVLALLAGVGVPALGQWLSHERPHPASRLVSGEDFIAESGMTTDFMAVAESPGGYVAPAP